MINRITSYINKYIKLWSSLEEKILANRLTYLSKEALIQLKENVQRIKRKGVQDIFVETGF